MKVSGFSFIRNAVKNDYPVKEAIESVLPLCDDFYVAMGLPDDGTGALIRSIGSSKIRILDSVWDETLKTGGRVFAQETNKAMDAIPDDSDWAFYIQGDECVHEKYLPVIRDAMEKYLHDPRVEGLLFNYTHFYGSYHHIGTSRNWYRREIRLVRNDKQIRSYRDAQGFRKNGRKLQVKLIDASIYHYGWAQSSRGLAKKSHNFSTFYTGVQAAPKVAAEEFDYSNAYRIMPFTGSHPQVIKDRVAHAPADFVPESVTGKAKLSLRRSLLQKLEDLSGYRLGEYKNYTLIR